jgi:hypothetical protein
VPPLWQRPGNLRSARQWCEARARPTHSLCCVPSVHVRLGGSCDASTWRANLGCTPALTTNHSRCPQSRQRHKPDSTTRIVAVLRLLRFRPQRPHSQDAKPCRWPSPGPPPDNTFAFSLRRCGDEKLYGRIRSRSARPCPYSSRRCLASDALSSRWPRPGSGTPNDPGEEALVHGSGFRRIMSVKPRSGVAP